jgi:DNA polymerase-3 subunit gamma/tau
MRDALSIMDQAIASAPVEDGRAVLSATQIRELMGSVPNAVFERLLEAVAAGQSAELMEQLNILVNAGHSPSSLARQMVRYLRNTLMAKLGGEQTELLQISGDERARAARTALLFTEEEITRNLQIVLRTFDDLNYRQEQRFHLELGLLKLIHAQRLLPIEELLSGAGSGVVSGSGARSASQSTPRPASAPAPSASRAPATSSPAAPAAAPSISPFASGGWNSGPSSKLSSVTSPVSQSPATEMVRTSPAIASEVTSSTQNSASPFPAASTPALGYASTATLTEGALAMAPETVSPAQGAPTVDALRDAIGSALVNAGHSSAAQLLGTATWLLDTASLRIEVPGVGKKMLSLTVNAAAEKMIRQELQRLGAPSRFMVVPGEGAAQAAAPMAAPLAGSVQEAALTNPLVQRAQEIFKAEVRSVVDLRLK